MIFFTGSIDNKGMCDMSDLREELELEALEEILEEEFNPELFYKALSNALEQLEHYSAEAA